MSAVWITVVVVGLATIAIKAAGPILLARRTPPPRAPAGCPPATMPPPQVPATEAASGNCTPQAG